MTSVKEAVRFNHLLNQLSDMEKQQLIAQLSSRSNDITKLFTNLLCNYFMNHPNDAPDANEIISTIIIIKIHLI